MLGIFAIIRELLITWKCLENKKARNDKIEVNLDVRVNMLAHVPKV